MSSVVEWIMLVSRGYTVLVSALELIIVSGTVVKHSESLELLLDLDEFKPFFFSTSFFIILMHQDYNCDQRRDGGGREKSKRRRKRGRRSRW